MNRLIILGNGFDLAHDIKSSFNHFISNYFCDAINTFHEEESYVDPMFLLKFKNSNMYFSTKQEHVTSENVYKILDKLRQSKELKCEFHSPLLENIYNQTSQLRWVDVEVEFFNVLIEIKKSNNIEYIRKVNSQLDFLKSKLVKYLDDQQSAFSNNFDRSYLTEKFCEKIYKHDIVTVHLEECKMPDNLYFLNFNYTNTFEDYLRDCKKIIPSTSNYIHGSLGGVHGEPIFGFGDEFDKKYIEFEDEKNNELFKHIKSFDYLQTKNYYLLTRFIEADDFQVHIYGHSCGISDRTMLNQIFEHENCKSIKIFYHKIDEENNDFTEKTYEISRHFKDKGMLRKKLVPFDLSREMPQPVLSTTSVTSK